MTRNPADTGHIRTPDSSHRIRTASDNPDKRRIGRPKEQDRNQTGITFTRTTERPARNTGIPHHPEVGDTSTFRTKRTDRIGRETPEPQNNRTQPGYADGDTRPTHDALPRPTNRHHNRQSRETAHDTTDTFGGETSEQEHRPHQSNRPTLCHTDSRRRTRNQSAHNRKRKQRLNHQFYRRHSGF